MALVLVAMSTSQIPALIAPFVPKMTATLNFVEMVRVFVIFPEKAPFQGLGLWLASQTAISKAPLILAMVKAINIAIVLSAILAETNNYLTPIQAIGSYQS